MATSKSFISTSFTEAYMILVAMWALTFIFCIGCWLYNKSIAKCNSYSTMPTFTFLTFSMVQWIRKTTYQILGPSYKKAVPFFIYIIAVFWFSNILSILGLEPLGSNLLIPFTTAMMVFFGTVISGLIYRGYKYFADYVKWIKIGGRKIFPILDPFRVIGELSKVLSMSFRLWGNTLAGSLILFIIYDMITVGGSTGGFFDSVNYLGPVLLPFFVFPIHIYFDIFGPACQSMIFILLTMCFWALARHGEGASAKNYDVNVDEIIS